MTLTYGPVGDPTSRDPFERGQALMPEGWHLEGQTFGYGYFAHGKGGGHWVHGRTVEEVARAAQEHPVRGCWDTYRQAVAAAGYPVWRWGPEGAGG